MKYIQCKDRVNLTFRSVKGPIVAIYIGLTGCAKVKKALRFSD